MDNSTAYGAESSPIVLHEERSLLPSPQTNKATSISLRHCKNLITMYPLPPPARPPTPTPFYNAYSPVLMNCDLISDQLQELDLLQPPFAAITQVYKIPKRSTALPPVDSDRRNPSRFRSAEILRHPYSLRHGDGGGSCQDVKPRTVLSRIALSAHWSQICPLTLCPPRGATSKIHEDGFNCKLLKVCYVSISAL